MNCRPPQSRNFQAKLTENGKGKNIGTPRNHILTVIRSSKILYFHSES